MIVNTKDRIKRIYDILPKIDCGRCGFGTCAKFARAVAGGQASPFACRQDSGAGYAISRIMGAGISGESASVPGPDFGSSRQALEQDIQILSNKVDDILARIESIESS